MSELARVRFLVSAGVTQPKKTMNPFELPNVDQRSGDDPPNRVPESEWQIDFVRSSGPGGQKVNKTSSKAQLRWNIERSSAFSPEQKARIRQGLANRINKEGEIVLASDQLRSQSQNKSFVVEQLQRLVDEALTPQAERVATRPPRSSKERRLEDKKRQSLKKETRRWEE